MHIRLFRKKPKTVESTRRSVRKAKKQRRVDFRRALGRAFSREIRLFLVIFLGYFLQVTAVSTAGDYLGVTPLLTLSVIAIVTVCYGRVQAFWCGAIYGILLELMLPGTILMNLFVYPASALLWSVPFADKSAKQLEYERGIGKAGRNRSPVMRTLLCVITNALTYEAVNIVYIYLRENVLLPVHFSRAFADMLATLLLTLIVLVPLRRFFGYRTVPKTQRAAKPRPYAV